VRQNIGATKVNSLYGWRVLKLTGFTALLLAIRWSIHRLACSSTDNVAQCARRSVVAPASR